jgi:hypothetical protein
MGFIFWATVPMGDDERQLERAMLGRSRRKECESSLKSVDENKSV